ncbi:hypothetical protein JXR01_03355 [Candidatus Kaiserbacteria bacterium]|nr:MAG: hypothetical protein JXR01_03355 [Candidatus Kaiserbacteria bacterium]
MNMKSTISIILALIVLAGAYYFFMSTEKGVSPVTESQAGEIDNSTLYDEARFIGMTEAEASAYAEANNVRFRVGKIDGEGLAVTADFVIGRITAEIEDGIVVGYTVE